MAEQPVPSDFSPTRRRHDAAAAYTPEQQRPVNMSSTLVTSTATNRKSRSRNHSSQNRTVVGASLDDVISVSSNTSYGSQWGEGGAAGSSYLDLPTPQRRPMHPSHAASLVQNRKGGTSTALEGTSPTTQTTSGGTSLPSNPPAASVPQQVALSAILRAQEACPSSSSDSNVSVLEKVRRDRREQRKRHSAGQFDEHRGRTSATADAISSDSGSYSYSYSYSYPTSGYDLSSISHGMQEETDPSSYYYPRTGSSGSDVGKGGRDDEYSYSYSSRIVRDSNDDTVYTACSTCGELITVRHDTDASDSSSSYSYCSTCSCSRCGGRGDRVDDIPEDDNSQRLASRSRNPNPHSATTSDDDAMLLDELASLDGVKLLSLPSHGVALAGDEEGAQGKGLVPMPRPNYPLPPIPGMEQQVSAAAVESDGCTAEPNKEPAVLELPPVVPEHKGATEEPGGSTCRKVEMVLECRETQTDAVLVLSEESKKNETIECGTAMGLSRKPSMIEEGTDIQTPLLPRQEQTENQCDDDMKQANATFVERFDRETDVVDLIPREEKGVDAVLFSPESESARLQSILATFVEQEETRQREYLGEDEASQFLFLETRREEAYVALQDREELLRLQQVKVQQLEDSLVQKEEFHKEELLSLRQDQWLEIYRWQLKVGWSDLFLEEQQRRQAVEEEASHVFLAEMYPAFQRRKEEMQVTTLKQTIRDLESTIDHMTTELAQQKQISTSMEASLRTRLFQSVKVNSTASTYSSMEKKSNQQQFDLDIPIHERFARAHSTAVRSVETQQLRPNSSY